LKPSTRSFASSAPVLSAVTAPRCPEEQPIQIGILQQAEVRKISRPMINGGEKILEAFEGSP
jgi:hypothetical protein